MGYFIPIFVEQGNTEDFFQFLVTVIPNIGMTSVRFQEIIPLLPYPDGMRLDPGKVFQVFYGKDVHLTIYKENSILV
jgi:hypothetical protein